MRISGPNADANAALDPRNFPRWAQACPKAFEKLQRAIVGAALVSAHLNLTPAQKKGFSDAMGQLSAIAFAAGRESVEEAKINGLLEQDLL